MSNKKISSDEKVKRIRGRVIYVDLSEKHSKKLDKIMEKFDFNVSNAIRFLIDTQEI